MLKDIEPPFDIRFVEKVGTRTEIHNIYNFPAIVGHLGTVKPLLCRIGISRQHARISYDILNKSYRVEDGIDGKPSANHIYYSDGGEAIEVPFVDLVKPGQIVYLIRPMVDGTEARLELYDPRRSYSYECPTQDLDPRYVLTEKKAEEAHSIAKKNEEKIAELDGKLETIWALNQRIGSNPLITLKTIGVVFLALCAITPFYLLYRYVESTPSIFSPSTEQNKSK